MPEPVVPVVKEEEKVKPLGIEVRDKSFQQLLREQEEEKNKSADEKPLEPTEEEKKAEEEKKLKEAEDAKTKEAADKKAEEEKQTAIATKAAEDVIKKQEEEKQKELDRIKAEEDEKRKQEALKPAWQTDPNAPKDKDGNPIPRSYEEITKEAARIAREETLAEIEVREKARQEEADKTAAQKTQTEEQQKAQQQALSDQLQKELDADLTDLYAGNKLPKIKDPKNENDPGIKEQRNLFETAQKVNAERMTKGLPPIRSIKLIYYEHYKPLKKPAGFDAPVLGAEPNQSDELPEDQYIPSRDRNKSIAQLVKEEAAKFAKKINIRGN